MFQAIIKLITTIKLITMIKLIAILLLIQVGHNLVIADSEFENFL